MALEYPWCSKVNTEAEDHGIAIRTRVTSSSAEENTATPAIAIFDCV
jgi:hypothetical protein